MVRRRVVRVVVRLAARRGAAGLGRRREPGGRAQRRRVRRRRHAHADGGDVRAGGRRDAARGGRGAACRLGRRGRGAHVARVRVRRGRRMPPRAGGRAAEGGPAAGRAPVHAPAGVLIVLARQPPAAAGCAARRGDRRRSAAVGHGQVPRALRRRVVNCVGRGGCHLRRPVRLHRPRPAARVGAPGLQTPRAPPAATCNQNRRGRRARPAAAAAARSAAARAQRQPALRAGRPIPEGTVGLRVGLAAAASRAARRKCAHGRLRHAACLRARPRRAGACRGGARARRARGRGVRGRRGRARRLGRCRRGVRARRCPPARLRPAPVSLTVLIVGRPCEADAPPAYRACPCSACADVPGHSRQGRASGRLRSGPLPPSHSFWSTPALLHAGMAGAGARARACTRSTWPVSSSLRNATAPG